jgi:CysZ protein
MLQALSLTVRQLGDPKIIRVLAKSLGFTLLVFLIFGIGLVFVFRWFAAAHGGGRDGGFAAAAMAVLAAAVLGWLLFRAIAIPVMSFFADEVVAAVEKAHFSSAAESALKVSFATNIRMAGASLLRLIGLNLIALPAYLFLMFTAVGPFVLFVIVNALLLGRDLGEMVAVRHLDQRAMKDWLRMTRAPRAAMGMIVTGLLLVPVVNLIAPIIGAGMATHLFHRRHT